MQNDRNLDERIKSIRHAMEVGSQPKQQRRWTDAPGLHVFGDKNVYAGTVVYHFGQGTGPVVTPRSFKGVDWKQAPKLAQWWAIDKDGVAHWFCRPNVAAFTEFWYAESVIAPDFEYDGDWRDSLTERPRTER